MTHILATHLPPLQRELLLAIAKTPEQRLLRTRGGYAAPGATAADPVFTIRTVNAAHRDWLVQLVGPFSADVRLTAKGCVLAQRLIAADEANARVQVNAGTQAHLQAVAS